MKGAGGDCDTVNVAKDGGSGDTWPPTDAVIRELSPKKVGINATSCFLAGRNRLYSLF
jgi:hypothetical protein